ncbi:hypothetical protein V1523DRAFT_132715 [Lipomyces doorenjongii]
MHLFTDCELIFFIFRYPYLAYDSCAEYVTVVTPPSSLHEDAALGRMILDRAREHLSSNGADVTLIRNSRSTTMKGTYGNYIRSKKQADGAIVCSREDPPDEVMIAIEVEYSEHYAALCRNKDKDTWIDGQRVKVCILVCPDEVPRFGNPRTLDDYVGDVRAEMNRMVQHFSERRRRIARKAAMVILNTAATSGVGDLNEAFIEVWRANKRQPTRYQLIQNPWPCNRLPKTIGLKIRDFIPDEDWKAANIPGGSVIFDEHLYTQETHEGNGGGKISGLYSALNSPVLPARHNYI